jgi:aryl-alcohol dehydrogenase-like predicted oxidoreductase
MLADKWQRPRLGDERCAIALGAMNFGGRTPEDESKRMIARAIERGVDLIDTANAYGDGASEKIVGRAIKSLGVTLSIASKVGLKRIAGKSEGLRPERVLAAVEETLDNLGIETLDLYYLHAPDPTTPLDETLGALEALIEQNRIRAWGMSNYASWEVLEAASIAKSIELPPPRIAQVIYNLLIRQLDVEWFRFAARHRVHTTVYNALGGGLLSGKHKQTDKPAKGSRFDKNRMYVDRYWTDRNFALVEQYGEVARRAGIDLPALAHAWLAGRAGVDSILIGPATLPQLDAALDGVELVLSSEARAEIERIHLHAMGTDARYAR